MNIFAATWHNASIIFVVGISTSATDLWKMEHSLFFCDLEAMRTTPVSSNNHQLMAWANPSPSYWRLLRRYFVCRLPEYCHV